MTYSIRNANTAGEFRWLDVTQILLEAPDEPLPVPSSPTGGSSFTSGGGASASAVAQGVEGGGSGSSSTAAIVGGCVGGVALLLLLALLAFCIYRRRRKTRSTWQEDTPHFASDSHNEVVYAAAPVTSPLSPSTFGMTESRPVSVASYPITASPGPDSIESRPASGFFALPGASATKGDGSELDAPPAYDSAGPSTLR